MNSVPAVDRGDGVHPLGTLRGQVRQFQIAATGVRRCNDFAGQFSRIVVIATMLAEVAPSPSQIGLAENFTRFWSFALRQKFMNGMFEQSEFRCAPFPHMRYFLSDGDAFLRKSCGRFNEVGKFLRTKALMKCQIAVRRSGN